MTHTINTIFGFLGGTILAVEGGYKVLPQTASARIFGRLADAKWFLALQWCDKWSTSAGILTNVSQIPFHNEQALTLGADVFIPLDYRSAIFKLCLPLAPLETARYNLPVEYSTACRTLEIQGIEIDPRYGKVALVRECSGKGSAVAMAEGHRNCTCWHHHLQSGDAWRNKSESGAIHSECSFKCLSIYLKSGHRSGKINSFSSRI